MSTRSQNYHFMIDDKFIDDFINDANSISDNNHYILTFNPPSKFVKSKEGIHAPYESNGLSDILKKIRGVDRVFIHFYLPQIDDILKQLPDDTKVFLFFWGGDFLDAPFFSNPNNELSRFLFDALTFEYVSKSIGHQQSELLNDRLAKAKETGNIKNVIATRAQNFKRRKQTKKNEIYHQIMRDRRNFLNRLEAICHWNQFDVEFLNDLYDVSLTQHYFVYGVGANEMDSSKTTESDNDKLTIWLGNSDTETNNHLDAIQELSHLKDQNVRIICPLNYGNKAYADVVNTMGQEVFGDKFEAILDFIPREDYYNLMNEADIVYMPHNRGQAAGNIFAFIKKGKKVFMKEQSSIYKLFGTLDIHVYNSSELKNATFEKLKAPLTEDLRQKNIDNLNASLTNEEKRITALKEILTNG